MKMHYKNVNVECLLYFYASIILLKKILNHHVIRISKVIVYFNIKMFLGYIYLCHIKYAITYKWLALVTRADEWWCKSMHQIITFMFSNKEIIPKNKWESVIFVAIYV